jgi:hypothetical protein
LVFVGEGLEPSFHHCATWLRQLSMPRVKVRKSFLDRYIVQEVGGREHSEYWIPASDLAAFNAAIVGQIEVVMTFS